MARGAEAKTIVGNAILETFEGSFQYDKEIRIPIMENGELIQIKVTLTAAKVNVEKGGENQLPGTVTESNVTKSSQPVSQEVSPEEKANVSKMLAALGL